MPEYLVRVVSGHFVAGIVVTDDLVTSAAPILRWTIGRRRDWLRFYFARKGWVAKILKGA